MTKLTSNVPTVRDLIYIEKDLTNSKLSPSKLDLFRVYSSIPERFDVTINEYFLAKHVVANSYRVVIGIVSSMEGYNFFRKIMQAENTDVQRIYLINQTTEKTDISGWMARFKINIHADSISNEVFDNYYKRIVWSLLKEDVDYIVPKIIGGNYQKIYIKDILFLSGTGYSTKVHTTSNEEFKTRLTQKQFLSLFPSNIFKAHKSYSVNKMHVLSTDNGRFQLRNGHSIPKGQNADWKKLAEAV